MRILYTGIAAFVIWSFFSTWLYVDVLRHAAKPTVTGNSGKAALTRWRNFMP
jgi:hypothetical protein